MSNRDISPHLTAGETVQKKDHGLFITGMKSKTGQLFLTNTRLLFVGQEKSGGVVHLDLPTEEITGFKFSKAYKALVVEHPGGSAKLLVQYESEWHEALVGQTGLPADGWSSTSEYFEPFLRQHLLPGESVRKKSVAFWDRVFVPKVGELFVTNQRVLFCVAKVGGLPSRVVDVKMTTDIALGAIEEVEVWKKGHKRRLVIHHGKKKVKFIVHYADEFAALIKSP